METSETCLTGSRSSLILARSMSAFAMLVINPSLCIEILKNNLDIGGGGGNGGQMVSVLTFYSDDPSSNPADAYSFFCEICV